MRRSRSKAFLVALAAASGCAFPEGQPWAVAEFDVTIMHDGDIAEVEIAAIELEMETAGAVEAPEEDHGHAHGPAEPTVEEDGAYLVTAIPHGPVVPTAAGVHVEIEECTDDCRLPRGELHAARLVIEGVTLADGTFVELDTAVTAEIEGEVDRDHPGGVRLELRYALPADLTTVVDQPLRAEVQMVALADIERLDHDHEDH